ncbi:MAG: LuxR family transcriptional regulator [Dehalococcoidia bacterium]
MPAKKHSYLRTHKLAGAVLQLDASAEEAKLREQAARSKSGRAAKTLVKEGRLRVTLVALRKGTALGAHAVAGDVTIEVRRGAIEIGMDKTSVRASKGDLIALRARVRHDARALRDSTILITASMR